MTEKKGLRFQFGLRAILVLILLVCIGSSFYRRYTAYLAIDAIQKKAGFVRPTPKAQGWKRLFSNDVYRVHHLSFHNSFGVTDYDVAAITRLPWLRRLSLHRTKVSDKSTEYVAKLRLLEALSFQGTAVTDKGLESLADLKKLKSLSLNQTNITDAGLAHLSELADMETLLLQGVKFRSFEHFKEMKKLKRLELDGRTKIQPSELSHLQEMRRMEELSIPAVALRSSGRFPLQYMTSLRVLHLQSAMLSEMPKDTWQKFRHLEELAIGQSGEFFLENHEHVERIWLYGKQNTISLRKLPQLQTFETNPGSRRPPPSTIEQFAIEDCAQLKGLDVTAKQISLRNLESLGALRIVNAETIEVENLPNLHTIQFVETDVTSRLLSQLGLADGISYMSFAGGGRTFLQDPSSVPRFPNVHTLVFVDSRNPTPQKMAPNEAASLVNFLSRCPVLRQVQLPVSMSTLETIQPLLKLRGLTRVEIRCRDIERKDYLRLLELPNLQNLVVHDRTRTRPSSNRYRFAGNGPLPPNTEHRVVNGRSFVVDNW